MTNWPGDDGSSLYSGLTSPTVKIPGGADERVGETVPYGLEEPKTRIYRGPQQPGSAAELPAGDAMRDPPVGCLLLVGGKGRGAMLRLGYGRNSIGRGPKERVRLDFGDDQVSCNGHVEVICDPKRRKFYAQGTNQATNLAYIGDEPLLAPVELKGGEVIAVGDTHLRFVPFIGPDWDWNQGGG